MHKLTHTDKTTQIHKMQAWREREKYRTIWSKIQWHKWKGLPLLKIALHVCSRTVHVLCGVILFYHVSINSTLFSRFVSCRFILSPQVNFYWCYFSTHTHIALSHPYSWTYIDESKESFISSLCFHFCLKFQFELWFSSGSTGIFASQRKEFREKFAHEIFLHC